MKFLSKYKDDVTNKVTISVTGYIGEDFRGGDFINYIRTWHDKEEEIVLDFFSFGGSAFDAIAVYEFLRLNEYNKVSANIYGFCGSAATIIACAAQTVNMGQHSFFFVHNAYDGYSGEQNDNTQKVSEQIAAIYKKKTKLDLRIIRKLMDEGDQGALLGAKEAQTYGFVDKVIKEKLSMAAAFQQRFSEESAGDYSANSKSQTMNFNLKEWVNKVFGVTVENDAEAQKFLTEKAPAIVNKEGTAAQTGEGNTGAGEGAAAVVASAEEVTAIKAQVEQLQTASGNFATAEQLQELQSNVNAILEQVQQLAQATQEATQQVQAQATQTEASETDFQKKVNELTATIAAMRAAPPTAKPGEKGAGTETVPAVASQVQTAISGTVVNSTAADGVLARMTGKAAPGSSN